MSSEGFKELADELAKRFIAEGFVVHRYDAYSTNSVYIKLDCGMCNSIRVSDHRGKKHLKYRYNIGSWIRERYHENDKYPRHYYPISETDVLVKTVLRDRGRRIERYGADTYKSLMRKNEREGKKAKCGFWSQATKVSADA